MEGGEIMEYIMKPNNIVRPDAVAPPECCGCSVYVCPYDWMDGGIGKDCSPFCGSWCAYKG